MHLPPQYTRHILSITASLIFSALAAVAARPDVGGRMEATLPGGQTVPLPLLKTDVSARIAGDLATVTIRQVFENPRAIPLDATYLFPLNTRAAVHGMTMESGGNVIRAQIQRRAEATKTFTQAKEAGKAAALLTQERPNIFTQSIANLMPGQPLTVTLQYVQPVPKIDGAYEFVVPLVVGPRYNGTYLANDTGAAPTYPPVAGLTLPGSIAEERVSIDIALRAPVPLIQIWSPSHAITQEEQDRDVRVSLAAGRVIDNADFVLRYTLAGADTSAGMLTHEGTFSLLIEPPARPEADSIQRRELIFVLDTSGSMGGAPLDASKAFMRAALQSLRSTDSFQILSFSNNPSVFAKTALPANRRNISAGLAHVASLAAGGGTEIDRAIRAAFQRDLVPGALRNVVFLSDGYIGDEAQVLATIKSMIGSARIHAFGVGTAVNRYLLDEMAAVGRGTARYIDPSESGREAAEALARQIESPLLSDITIDWGEMAVSEVVPSVLPDLFAGDSVRVVGKLGGGGQHRITIRGQGNGQEMMLPLEVSADGADGAALPLIWARSRIAELMRERAVAPRGASGLDKIEEAVTALGLAHSLVTEWTAFVAVSDKVVNTDRDATEDAEVPLARVKAVGPGAYPAALAGSSTPEPEFWAGFALLSLMAAAGLRRRRRAPA